MKKLLLLGLVSTLANVHLYAQEFEVNSSITAVTVYNDRAAITRTIKTSLEPGASTLIIKNLPGNIILDSLRVNGTGTQKIEIGSVESRRSFSKLFNNLKEADLRSKIQALQDQRNEYQDQIQALDLQKTFMTSLVQTQPNLMREKLELGNIDPLVWQSAWSLIQSGSNELFKTRSTAVIAQRELNKEISLLNQELAQLATGQKETIDAYIALETMLAANGTFNLEYQIPGASWHPLYDARLDTDKSSIRIDQLASVSQTTGEDWSNVKLTLSTHRPSVNASFNSVSPWLLNFRDHYSIDKSLVSRMKSAAPEAMKYELDAALDEVVVNGMRLEDKKSDMQTATIAVSAFSAEYNIPGKITLVSERNARKFKIKDQTFDTKLLVMAAPHRSTKAYLHAQLNYAGDEPLLPGSVALFRDNAFVGNTRMSLLRPQEDIKLSFGIDEAIEIEYKALKEESGTNGLISKRDYIDQNYKTIVHNFHKQNIDLRILNRLPIAQHEDIKVEVNKNNTQATEMDLDDLKGIYAWDFELKPNQEKTINFGYTISYPTGKNIF